MRIFKYKLETFTTHVEIPSPCKVLTVQVQDGYPVAWVAISDPKARKSKHRFISLMTGQDYPERSIFADYVGTVQLETPRINPLVLHIFHEEQP